MSNVTMEIRSCVDMAHHKKSSLKPVFGITQTRLEDELLAKTWHCSPSLSKFRCCMRYVVEV